MTRYKCLTDDYDMFVCGKIYDDENEDTWQRVVDLIARYPHDWELVEENFVLPKNWHIEVTKTNAEALSQWRTDGKLIQLDGYLKNSHGVKGYWFMERPTGTEITTEQFKKYVLVEKKDKLSFPRMMMVYNYSRVAAVPRKILTFCRDRKKAQYIGVEHCYNNAEEMPQYSLPTINGYEGEYSKPDDRVSYGCAVFYVEKLRKLRGAFGISNKRTITSITLNSGVIITIGQIDQILGYVNNN